MWAMSSDENVCQNLLPSWRGALWSQRARRYLPGHGAAPRRNSFGECWVGRGRLANKKHSHSLLRAGGSPTHPHCAGGQGLLSLSALGNGFGALSKFFSGTKTKVLPQASVQGT